MLNTAATISFSFNLDDGRVINSPSKLAEVIAEETDNQIEKVYLATDDETADFCMSSDGLNLARALLRIREELGTDELGDVPDTLTNELCRIRGYDVDDFESALHATRDRARTPLGLTPLRLAEIRCRHKPLRLLHAAVCKSALATQIAGIAYYLQQEQENSPILLPIELLRQMLAKRKIVVSGAVTRLVDAGLLEVANAKYHTRRAREYRFVGEKGLHYEFANDGN